MRHLLARAVLVLLVGGVSAVACSDDAATDSPANDGGEAGQSAAGAPGDGGAGVGASDSGGRSGSATGGAPEALAGTSSDGGVTSTLGGAATGGVETAPEGGMAGAAGSGEPEPQPGPPDLITASGGPWPDSFTGSCANTKKSIVCPQKDAPFFGQDGTYRLNVPTYKTSATTLTDSVTGLVWQLTPERVTKTHADALAYCDGLSLAGKDDWRLPTRLEYVTVLDEGATNGTRMPPTVPQDSLGAYWTASATGVAANQFFFMNDLYGAWTVGVDSSAFMARCVRGPSLTGARAADTDVVTDTLTGLVWQATALDDSFVTWQSALAYCEGLSHDGKDDWRLPSIKELASVVDEAAAVAPVLYADLGGSAARYWSSTPAPSFGSDYLAFSLETSFGYVSSSNTTEAAAAARCVRSAD